MNLTNVNSHLDRL